MDRNEAYKKMIDDINAELDKVEKGLKVNSRDKHTHYALGRVFKVLAQSCGHDEQIDRDYQDDDQRDRNHDRYTESDPKEWSYGGRWD